MATNFIDTSDFTGRAILVQGISSVHSQYQTADKITIHFQKKGNKGGDVSKVLFPLGSNRDAAIVVFDDANDRESTLLQQHVFYEVSLQVQRLPPVFRSVEVEIDPVYVTLVPDVVHNLMRHQGHLNSARFGTQYTHKLLFSCPRDLRYAEENVYKFMARQSETAHVSSAATGYSDPEQAKPIEQEIMDYEEEVAFGRERNKYKETEPGDVDPENFIYQQTTGGDDSVTHATGDKKIEGNETSATDVQLRGPQYQTSGYGNSGFSTKKENSIVLDILSYDFIRKFKKDAVDKILQKYNVKIVQHKEGLMLRASFAAKGKTSAEAIQKAVDEFTTLHQTTYRTLNRKTVECPMSLSTAVLESAVSETSKVFKSNTLITKIDGSPIQYVILSSSDAEEVALHFRKSAGIRSKKKLRTVTPGPVPGNVETGSEFNTTSRPIATNPSMSTNESESKDMRHPLLFSNETSPPNASQQSLEESCGLKFLTNEGTSIFIQRGDITKQKVEAIVSPSNSTLDYSNEYVGAAARAILNAAGNNLLGSCSRIMKSRNYYPISVSDCVISPGFNLCSHVIHAVCPVNSGPCYLQQFHVELKSTFYKCLCLAGERKIKTLAIPLIGSGMMGALKKDCADALASVILDFSSKSKGIFKEVHLVNIDDEATEALKMSFKEMFQAERPYQSNPIAATGRNDVPDAALATGYSRQADDRRKDNDQLPEQQLKLQVKDNNKRLDANQIVQGVGKGESQKANTHSEVSPLTETTDECTICLHDKITDKKVLPCKHSFCKDCINEHLKKDYRCPICRAVCGQPKGNQPHGSMTDSRSSISLSGYEKDGVIKIRYDIPSGVQTKDHPNPGKRFTGDTRTAYLPDNQEGREVLSLLRKAFDARLVFTVGQSSTTGRDNTVTWNSIHHKTSYSGGPSNHGYPDPEYLKRVKEEIAALGIE